MERRNIQMLRNILMVFMCLIIFSSHCYAVQDVRESIVKIYCVKNSPDYDNPWNMKGLKSISGSGCIISDKRILTNAHVVSDKTYIQVRLHGKSEKYKARLLAVSHEADLALLTVDDLNFFKGVSPLKFGRLPEIQDKVTVYGFPEGGDALSTTTGIISRIEHQIYAHSFMNLLAAQIDAAVNSGNSGGPAMVGDQIVGVVMQSLIDSENTNYIVPAPIIEHFLQDMKDGRYDGFPQLGLVPQKMENK
jgi:S1-C subfamily serine protease